MSSIYLPGVNGGGPIQSIKNIITNLSSDFEFFVLTSDRDFGSTSPYVNVKIDEWQDVGNAKVMYTNVSKLDLNKMKKIINSEDFDSIYCNSFFSKKFSIYPLILKKTKQININKFIIAPRGEFSPGALSLKKFKKKSFIKFLHFINLHNDIFWHATTDDEKKLIKKNMNVNNDKIIVANNLTTNYSDLQFDKKIKKNPGELSIIFLSRIHPKKNLNYALELISKLKGDITFNIYGPIEDEKYWKEAQMIVSNMPKNIRVNYQGSVSHEKVLSKFNLNHVFLFPTLGENFGHVISESLIGGCPVIVSNQTPWNTLEKYSAGYSIDLVEKKKFLKVLNYYIELNNTDYRKISKKAFEYGKRKSTQIEDIKETKKIFI